MTEPYKPKLIEVALPLMTINAESAREKSIRHGHPSTLHLWWARRPLAAARAVLWASLVDDPSAHPEQFPTVELQQKERERLFDILERLVPWEAANDQRILSEAKAEIDKCFEGPAPVVLDPFGGGGAIPLEAARLGLTTLSGDLNPVAVLIQKAMLEIPSRFAGQAPVNTRARQKRMSWSANQGLAADVESFGDWMREEAERRIGVHYPSADGPDGRPLTAAAWIWARTIHSPDPTWHGRVPLVRSWIVAKKPKRPPIWVEPIVDADTQTVSYRVREDGDPLEGSVGRSGAHCVATGAPIPFEYIREEARNGRLGVQLMAVVAEGDNQRVYLGPSDKQAAAAACQVSEKVVTGEIFDWPGRTNVVRYGMTEWEDLFTSRQLLALSTFSDLLDELQIVVRDACLSAGWEPDNTPLRDGGGGPDAYAEALVTFMALAIDKSTDYWSSICSWFNTKGEGIRNTFGRQAIPMTWDFAEANPFSKSTGSWKVTIDWIQRVVERLPAHAHASIEQMDAKARVAMAAPCVVCTDPPYYDNISYADLSDFFYVWLRRNLRNIWPSELATLATPKAEELIANRYRAGSQAEALRHFEQGMRGVFAEIAEAQDPWVPATVFYAFKQSEDSVDGRTSTGWETFLQGLLDAGLSITATWPMRTEMGNRMIASGSAALASSIVISCRPRSVSAALETRGGFGSALREELPEAVRLLQHENIAPVDLAQSAIGPGMRIFSRYLRVVEADGTTMSVRTALGLINEVLGEVLSAEEAELDPDSRFALTWFEQFAHNPGPHGDADVLARAKDTSVRGVVEAGIAVSRDGRLRLMERDELPAGWSPIIDARATVWESTQHLVRRLGVSESAAAELLAQLGGVADRARQLAYLLYGVCERNGWTDDAVAYNGLITAWPELTRLATGVGTGPDQQSFT